MKCFIAVDEATLLRLWLKDPALIQPFTRPFYPIRRHHEAANEVVSRLENVTLSATHDTQTESLESTPSSQA
ncbi:hypothetical protein A3715_01300 [Oleiphilus sp. HI0009]|uniref:hypothetical protein n=1 Tax=unclassified Oleiphilus TaxID=2631174 RepID=UPI0007C32FB8|nr:MULTISPECIES: hypothetical protein [unclassified Oleiphilus]KZX76610.1 hypothetical protein A3715_21805 [Oleiphilus sp. HI0009]MCH2157783.1 hypothetical protein [Oleiphilaceae bacterium]KZX78791.1 hypothetical protein A3715_01300 [Oleiphilus sp. HI0009]KZY63412.1 hypothetical protein A3738_11985 [Oleiphilus sp. HI0066]KZY66402.1 hypothetical protein A3738_16940 [Oleiphilus sp. HI0066]